MPRGWLERVERVGHGERRREPIASEDQALEMLLMGLRLTEGIELERLARASGRPVDQSLRVEALAAFIEDGWLERDDRRLRATEEGFLRLNAIIAALIEPTAEPLPDNRPIDGRLTAA
jgi:oxygen-independent coproporphyrinogen-3 oxidase